MDPPAVVKPVVHRLTDHVPVVVEAGVGLYDSAGTVTSYIDPLPPRSTTRTLVYPDMAGCPAPSEASFVLRVWPNSEL